MNSTPRYFMDLPQIPNIAELNIVTAVSVIKKEVEDALLGDDEKPLNGLSSISGPCKVEYDTQELGPPVSDNEENKDVSPVDSKEPYPLFKSYSNEFLSPKHENVSCLTLPSNSRPCKFEYDTEELEPICSDNEGTS
ncbi:hypothetical protein QYM36_011655 [Artemia franciscana]|uniref:Uncharacterized protein n=1 Tax=Artemia franciscana TaxID=6661 RepID=A0AA88L9D9_ARTSF|nr:hypothetical protein QYM36_011655 [Artemia franciscana]KAK2713025.1 hypothetical protein QYM36_011655 [Artemia franciscana]